MKKRQVQAGYWLRMAVITAWMALAAGCSHMQEPEVLGKLETEGEDSQELSEAFDGFPGMPGVPERYEAELQEEGLMLTADAQVELPDAISPGNHRLVSLRQVRYGLAEKSGAGCPGAESGGKKAAPCVPD